MLDHWEIPQPHNSIMKHTSNGLNKEPIFRHRSEDVQIRKVAMLIIAPLPEVVKPRHQEQIFPIEPRQARNTTTKDL